MTPKTEESTNSNTPDPQEPSNQAASLLFCSFCGKNRHEVAKLIAGPSVFICDECVGLCNEIIRHELGIRASISKIKERLSQIMPRLSIPRLLILVIILQLLTVVLIAVG